MNTDCLVTIDHKLREKFNTIIGNIDILLYTQRVTCVPTHRRLLEEARTQASELFENMERELIEKSIALEEANAGLEEKVSDRTKRLIAVNKELSNANRELKQAQVQLLQREKMVAMGQLAGGIAHEINNPLGVILGFSQVIMKRVKEDDPLYKPIKSIERESMRCRKLVMNLLTFSRTGSQERDKTDINTMLEEVLEIVGYQAKLRGIEIINSFGQDIPDILADKNQLQQVIMNLCTNAIDSMKNGRPGKMEIRTAKEEEDGYCGAKIEIEDNGSGISEEVRERMFEPFFTTKEVGQGTGLGLSICYEIIQRHNGSIYVESEKGKGSKFTIRLPIA